jgi:thiol-disulfide isomerase/thioredoxin/tetratricopeptide (TPR) repeat protein
LVLFVLLALPTVYRAKLRSENQVKSEDRDTIQLMGCRCIAILVCLFCSGIVPITSLGQSNSAAPATHTKPTTAQNKAAQKQAAKPLSAAEELQKAITDAGNDRAALVKNLQEYLEKYPNAPERPQIYRALVEACMQFHDDACATNYAERIVALTPDDVSMTLLAIQLLERSGDVEGLRRAVTYATRVFESVRGSPISEKSPRVSEDEWEGQKKRDESAILALRGRLDGRLQQGAASRKDFEESYALMPNASAALKLGELDELEKNYRGAATQYARAFALSDTATKSSNRHDIRQKLGNAWRLAYGSDAGLGDFLLKTIDDVTATAETPRARRNKGVKDAYAFVLRHAPDGAEYPVSGQKGKVLVINFWATWCGPCRALEPIYAKLAAQYSGNAGVVFLSANCDDDESLVGPYLAERKPRSSEVFSDGLAELFGVDSFPTVLILDHAGKVVFRANGFDPETIERDLGDAIRQAVTVPAKADLPAAPAAH